MTYKEFEKVYNEKVKSMKKIEISNEWLLHQSTISYYLFCAKVKPDDSLPKGKSFK